MSRQIESGVAVGEDPDHAGGTADRPVDPFLRYFELTK
jgi:hypothetical protein